MKRSGKLYVGPVPEHWREAARRKHGKLSRRLADAAEQQAGMRRRRDGR